MAFDPNPATRHLLNDLNMEAEVTDESSARVRIPVTPHITGPDGGVRAGVLAVLVDVVGGSAVLRSMFPDWMATADLTLQIVRPAVGPFVEARAFLLRRGRTTLVVEALVYEVGADDGADPTGPDGSGALVAWASMTFAVLPGGGSALNREISTDLPTQWALTSSGLDRPIDQVLGISVDDPASGLVSLPVHEYLHNSFGAVQGGVMALLGEVAAAEMLAAAGGPATVPVVTDLQVAYLSLGRVGPIVTRTRLLEDGSPTSGGSAVVELIDQGAEGRLTTVINVRAARTVQAVGAGQ
jgi:uncharacterized protein (TIGR00369 family)